MDVRRAPVNPPMDNTINQNDLLELAEAQEWERAAAGRVGYATRLRKRLFRAVGLIATSTSTARYDFDDGASVLVATLTCESAASIIPGAANGGSTAPPSSSGGWSTMKHLETRLIDVADHFRSILREAIAYGEGPFQLEVIPSEDGFEAWVLDRDGKRVDLLDGSQTSHGKADNDGADLLTDDELDGLAARDEKRMQAALSHDVDSGFCHAP